MNTNVFSPKDVCFDEASMTLILRLKEENVKTKNFTEYVKKPELEIIIIGEGAGKVLQQAIAGLDTITHSKLLQRVKELINAISWRYFLTNDLYKVSKKYSETDQRESILLSAEVPYIMQFYVSLNGILKVDLQPPKTYITLFTKGTDIIEEPEKAELEPIGS